MSDANGSFDPSQNSGAVRPILSAAVGNFAAVSERYPLLDEISLTRAEAKSVLFALDAARDAVPNDEAVFLQVVEAAELLVSKFLPDLPNL